MDWAAEDQTATFRLIRPERAGHFIFSSPHAGGIYPADMGADAALNEAELRSAEDALVDRLILPGVECGAILLIGEVGRAYIDLNRSPEDMDPQLIEGVAATTSARVASGYGVIPRLSGRGRPLYARTLSLTEAQARINAVHAPYHAALQTEMMQTRQREGSAVLVDWHSMPARATRGPNGGRGVEVVLGDRHGSSCKGDLTQRLRALFEAEGLRVALNHPYAGGWTTEHWGRPEEGLHAIQVELSRALYFDEAARRPSPGWNRTASAVARVIAALIKG